MVPRFFSLFEERTTLRAYMLSVFRCECRPVQEVLSFFGRKKKEKGNRALDVTRHEDMLRFFFC